MSLSLILCSSDEDLLAVACRFGILLVGLSGKTVEKNYIYQPLFPKPSLIMCSPLSEVNGDLECISLDTYSQTAWDLPIRGPEEERGRWTRGSLSYPGDPFSNFSSKAAVQCLKMSCAFGRTHLHFMFKSFTAPINRGEWSLGRALCVRMHWKLSLISCCKDARKNGHNESVFWFYFQIWLSRAIFSLVWEYLFCEFI